MKWSWKIGTIAGIGIYLHWTFLLLLIAVFVFYASAGGSWMAGLTGAGFILALFGCVILHELGHALTARRYGVKTADITLLPIGGVARLQRMPEHPIQEFLVAIAGPLVNVVIAGILFGIVITDQGPAALGPERVFAGAFLPSLMWANIILVAFNLLPAFPMDGGRMLRAILATRMSYSRATNIAATIGQGMAILFALVGLLVGNFFLLFIALFVYLGAAGEARFVEIRMLLRDVPVADAMIRHFRSLSVDDSLRDAANELLAGMQPDFPVLEDGQFRGMLRRKDVVEGLKQEGRELRVRDVMTADCPVVSQRDMLERVMTEMQQRSCSVLPVVEDGHVTGIVTLENVGELMMIRSALSGEEAAHSEDLAHAA